MAGVQIDGVNNKIDFDDDLDTSISANTDDTLVIEAGGNTMATITATTFTINDGTTITTADNTDTLTLTSTDADGNQGPILRLNRDSGSPADGDVIGEIHFNADDDAGNTTSFFSMSANIRDASNGDEDVQMVFKGFRGGNNVNYLEFDSDHVVFNEGSADIDFRVESNDRTSMLNVDAGLNKVGIGDVPDLGFLHVKVADSGASVNTGHDTLVLEESGNSGISILSGTSSNGAICFGDSGNNCIGYINYAHNGDHLDFGVNNAEQMRLNSDGILTLNEDAPDTGEGGITLNQGASDEMIMSFKSSDIAQGMTSVKQADTYGFIEKKSGANGGIKMGGLTDNADGHAFEAVGFQASENTAEATSASSAVCVNGFKRNGSTNAAEALPAGGNVFGIKNADDMQCLFKGDGEIHTNTAGTSNTGSVSTFDGYDDAQLVRAYDLSKGHYARGLIDSQFDKFVKYNIQDLVDANIIGTDDEGNATSFVNITGLQRLHNGAIWQQYEKHQKLAEAVYEMAKETLGADKADAILKKHDIKLLN
ncbi:hypothetical protein N8Y98_02815 [Pelagibacterales bacterium]|nr:hypothetical protein [Pelagibacterales bacterium]